MTEHREAWWSQSGLGRHFLTDLVQQVSWKPLSLHFAQVSFRSLHFDQLPSLYEQKEWVALLWAVTFDHHSQSQLTPDQQQLLPMPQTSGSESPVSIHPGNVGGVAPLFGCPLLPGAAAGNGQEEGAGTQGLLVSSVRSGQDPCKVTGCTDVSPWLRWQRRGQGPLAHMW